MTRTNSTTLIAIMAVAALGAGCGKKQPPPAGAGSGSAAAAGGTGAAGATDPAAPPPPADPAVTAVAQATSGVAALFAAPKPSVDRVGKIIDATAQLAKGVPREAWDPAAVVEAVGKDRAALFTWVRDHTALVPYAGSLRGAVGVMMDRVGNSLDRALLLAAVLTKAGFEVRLTHAELAPDAAAKLTATLFTRPRPAVPESKLDLDALTARFVADLGIDAATLKATTDKLDAASALLVKNVHARIASQTAAVTKLAPAGTAPAPTAAAELGDHWWVQVEDSGVWMDLDPSLPDGEPGQTLAPAGETIAVDDLGDDRRHTLTVRVIGEVWHGETREETTLLEHTFAPSKFFGQRISLTNVALDMPDEDTVRAAKDGTAALTGAITAQTEWFPVLRVGKGAVVKMSVTDGGELYDISATDANTTRLARAVQRATKSGVGAATGMLDTLPTDPGADPVAPKPPVPEHAGFTAEWIELELRGPGTEPRITRRTVFDALGLADRSTAKPTKLSDPARLDRGLALLGETELLPMFARLPEAFVTDLTIKSVVEARPALVELAGLAGAAASDDLRARFAKLTPMPSTLYALALARFDWSDVADQVYLDRLDLLSFGHRLFAVGAELHGRAGFDIVANDVDVWPRAGGDPRSVRIAQGVADTVAEAFVLGCPASRVSCRQGVNASNAFAATSQGWTAVTAAGATALGQLPPGARTLAVADLAAGYAIIVPPGPGAAATWWRVRLDTGETLGMGIAGGTATTEEILLAEQIAGLIVGSAFGLAGCIVGSHSWAQGAACAAAVGFSAAAGYAGIEYAKRRALFWATGMIAGLLGVTASGM